MKKSEVQAWLDGQGIDCRTISLCRRVDADGETVRGTQDDADDDVSDDPWFGSCDISGERGNVYRCTAVTKDGDMVDFDVASHLITGPLGRIAGAF